MRFSIGPLILQPRGTTDQGLIPTHEAPDEGTALLSNPTPRAPWSSTIKAMPYKIWHTIRAIWNPPLTGAVLAILIGLIPPVKHEFYHKEGFFYGTVTTSLINIGELFTALMLVVLGANLQIKSQDDSRTPIGILLYIYVMRFILMPLIGIFVVWKVSSWGWLDDDAHQGLGGDPMLKFIPSSHWPCSCFHRFILCLIPAGPPYYSPFLCFVDFSELLCWQILQNWQVLGWDKLESC
jgi:predicted permease